jgi:hypothetical protein
MRRILTVSAIAIILLGASLTAAAASVDSQAPAPQLTPPAGAVRGGMTTQCKVADRALVTPAMLADPSNIATLCAKSGLPGSGPAAPASNVARPFSTVSGNCGEAWFYIYNGTTSGLAKFYEGAYPWTSPIDYGSALVTWQNLTKGGFQRYSRYVWANTSGYSWTNWDYNVATKSGTVFGTMTGDVLLWDGSICTINWPTDTENVR